MTLLTPRLPLCTLINSSKVAVGKYSVTHSTAVYMQVRTAVEETNNNTGEFRRNDSTYRKWVGRDLPAEGYLFLSPFPFLLKQSSNHSNCDFVGLHNFLCRPGRVPVLLLEIKVGFGCGNMQLGATTCTSPMHAHGPTDALQSCI